MQSMVAKKKVAQYSSQEKAKRGMLPAHLTIYLLQTMRESA